MWEFGEGEVKRGAVKVNGRKKVVDIRGREGRACLKMTPFTHIQSLEGGHTT